MGKGKKEGRKKGGKDGEGRRRREGKGAPFLKF